MNKFLLVVVFLFSFSSCVFSQYLSNHRTSIFSARYFVNQERSSKKLFLKKLRTNSNSRYFLQKSKKFNNLSQICFTGQLVFFILQTKELTDGDLNPGYIYLAGNVFMGIWTIYFKDKSLSFLGKSIDTYNINKFNISLQGGKSLGNLLSLRVSF